MHLAGIWTHEMHHIFVFIHCFIIAISNMNSNTPPPLPPYTPYPGGRPCPVPPPLNVALFGRDERPVGGYPTNNGYSNMSYYSDNIQRQMFDATNLYTGSLAAPCLNFVTSPPDENNDFSSQAEDKESNETKVVESAEDFFALNVKNSIILFIMLTCLKMF